MFEAAGKVWRETTERPLKLIGSYELNGTGTVFYFADRPSTFVIVNPALIPWTDEARIVREGILIFCPIVENGPLNKRAAAAPSEQAC